MPVIGIIELPMTCAVLLSSSPQVRLPTGESVLTLLKQFTALC